MSKAAEIDLVSGYLADNVRALRESRGLTQSQISGRAGIPRPTWASLESGAANPTLQVLIKVASALQVRLEELLEAPRPTGKFYRSADLPTRARGKVRVRDLLPESLAGLDIERLEFAPGSHMRGMPHTAGTREYLTCESGKIELSESGTVWTLSPGDVVVFRGDQKHGYRNVSRGMSVAYSVIALAPVA
jgi:transcriptional regulator with XRE-family HTH domain